VDAKVKAPPHVILIFPFVELNVVFPVVDVKPNDVPLIVAVDNVPLIVVVMPDAPIVNAVAVDVPNDNVPADAVVRDGDVKAEPFITPVEEIEPVFEPFLNNVPIIFPDDAVIFPLVSVIDVKKVGAIKGAYVVDASADVKYEDKALLIKAVVANLNVESPAVGVGAVGDVINSLAPFNVVLELTFPIIIGTIADSVSTAPIKI
jgi:hypothetical protein